MSYTCSTHTTSQDTKSSFSIQRLSLLQLYLNGFSPITFKKLLIVLYMALCSQESLSSNGRILSKAIAVEETLLFQSFYSKLFSKPFWLFVSERAVACVKKWYIFESLGISTFQVHDCQTHSHRRIPRMNIVPTMENEDCRRWTAHCGPAHRLAWVSCYELPLWISQCGLLFWAFSKILYPLKKPLPKCGSTSPPYCPSLWSTLQKADCGYLWMPLVLWSRRPFLNVKAYKLARSGDQSKLVSHLLTLFLPSQVLGHFEPTQPQL